MILYVSPTPSPPHCSPQHYRHSIADITDEQLHETFNTNIFGMFFMTKVMLWPSG